MREEAFRGNYEAVDMLVDLEEALNDAFLTWQERRIVDFVFIADVPVRAVARLYGMTDEGVEIVIRSAASRLSNYLSELGE